MIFAGTLVTSQDLIAQPAPTQITSSVLNQISAFTQVSDVMDILNVNMVMMRILMTVGKHMKQMMEFQNTKYLNLPSLDVLGSCIPN